MNQMRNDPQSKSLAVTFYRYRGLVIRSLRNDINQGHKRASDVVLAGIITLLLVDVSLKCSMRNHPPILNHICYARLSKVPLPTGDTTWKGSRN